MLKSIIYSFLPWILYFILAGHTPDQLNIAIIAAAITSIIFEFKGIKKGFILSWGTLIFFIFMFIAVILFNNQWVMQHSWIFSNGTLALIAWISILIKKPFTIQYAKKQVSEDKWKHPLFIRINYILTSVWAISFSFSAFLHVIRIYNPIFPLWIYESLSYGFVIFAIWFTAWFPSWYREKEKHHT